MYVNQALSPVFVVLRSRPPLMPYRRRITIRWQSGGGPLRLPRSSGTRWSLSNRSLASLVNSLGERITRLGVCDAARLSPADSMSCGDLDRLTASDRDYSQALLYRACMGTVAAREVREARRSDDAAARTARRIVGVAVGQVEG